MSTDRQSERHGHDGFAEFTEELRLLAEVLLAKVEPVLRRTAADGQADLGGCAWCPVCAAAALVRGDHHDVVAALADHGTSMVTVLREALAGIPVEPVLPPEWPEHGATQHNSAGFRTRADSEHDHAADADPQHVGSSAGRRTGDPQRAGSSTRRSMADPTDADPQRAGSSTRRRGADPTDAGHDPSAGSAHADAGHSRRATSRPRRVDEYGAPRPARTPSAPHIVPESGAAETESGTSTFATTTPQAAERRRPTTEDRAAGARAARYVDIPVTIRG